MQTLLAEDREIPMKPSLSSSEETSLRRRLIYAKWLYQNGEQCSARRDELSQMLAIMHFHNAIETLVQNVVASYRYNGPRPMRSFKFNELLDVVDKKGGNDVAPPTLPDRALVLKLSEQRNSIMHHGHQFHRNEMEEAGRVCLQFLRTTLLEFFELNFDNLSMADLVKSDSPRSWLKSAESSLEKGNYLDAIILSVAVVSVIETRVTEAYSFKNGDFFRFRRGFDKWRALSRGGRHRAYLQLPHSYNELSRPIESAINKAFQQQHDDLEKVCDQVESAYKELQEQIVEEVSESNSKAWLMLSGVDLELARDFFNLEVVVKFRRHHTSVPDVQASYSKNANFDREHAELALRFATEAALKVQALGLPVGIDEESRTSKTRGYLGQYESIQQFPGPLNELKSRFERELHEVQARAKRNNEEAVAKAQAAEPIKEEAPASEASEIQ